MADNSISNIPVEIFATYVMEKLRKENPHLAQAFDETAMVLGGSVVHIPQAGASPNVVKNRKTFPATAVQRGDSHVTYTLDVYTTEPVHITWHEANEISYEKTDSVLNDHVQTLIEATGDNMIYNWCHGLTPSNGGYVPSLIPSSHIILTSGAATDVNAEDGQTGQRKEFVMADLAKAQSKMNKQKVPKSNRYALVESYMYGQLLNSMTDNQMAAFQASADLANGVVGKLYGFNIMDRSTVLAFDESGELRLPEEALDATDDLGVFCWHKESVTLAKGDMLPFQDNGNPLYYGDIFSGLVKFGGRCRRSNWDGVLVIKQGKVNP